MKRIRNLLGLFVVFAAFSAFYLLMNIDGLLNSYSIFSISVVVVGTCMSILGLSFMNPDIITNYELPKRIDHVSWLIGTCQKKIVIVSGMFSHKLFESERVKKALRRIPRDAEVEFYITGDEIDPYSRAVLDFIRDRNIDVELLPKNDGAEMNHAIVVDDVAVRLEFSGEHADDKNGTKAVIHKYAPELAKSVLNYIYDWKDSVLLEEQAAA